MIFRHVCEVAFGTPLPQSRDLEVAFDFPIKTAIRLSSKHADGTSPSSGSDSVCIAITESEVRGEAADYILASASSGEVKWVGAGLPEEKKKEVWAALDLTLLPLRSLIEATMTILRWRCGISRGAPNFIQSRKEHVSPNGEVWLEVPMARSISLSIKFGRPFKRIQDPTAIENDTVALVKAGITEPLGHQLFREAWNLQSSHPRSSLVIGVAAAEVGLKKLIGTLVPDAAWLVDELQSPPIEPLLRHYLPTLRVKAHFTGKPLKPPNKMISTLVKAFKARNKVVHAGYPPPSSTDLEQMLDTIDDFLWICDAYAGTGWVGDFVSPATVAEWKAAEPSK